MSTLNAAKVYLDSLENVKTKKAMQDGLFAVLLCHGEQSRLPEDIFTANWHMIEQQDVNEIKTRLIAQYSPNTVNLRLAALRGVLDTCWRMGLMTKDALERLRVEDVKFTRDAIGRMLDKFETTALLEACGPGVEGARNRAMIAIALQTGLRREELSDLTREGYNPYESRLTVIGKGNKMRHVYLGDQVRMILNEYLQYRGDSPDWLFYSLDAHGKLRPGKKLGVQGLHDMLQKVLANAGLDDISWHDFRRTFISRLLDSGVDIVQVSKMAGHSSVEQTKRYDRRPERTRQNLFTAINI